MLLAGFIQGFSGFGSVLLSLPLLALFLEPKTAIPLLALVGLLLTMLLLFPLWKDLEGRRVLPLLLGAAPGVPLGVFILKVLNGPVILAVIGTVLVLYALYGLVSRGTKKELGKGWAYMTGFISGCFGGAFSASGPPVIVYITLQPWSKELIKATLQGYYLFSGLLVVCSQSLTGLLTEEVWRLFVQSLPALIVGTYSGHFFFGKVREDLYRRVILLLLLCLGVFTIIRAV